jgi:formate hydrogenlyase subunit 6/NADH:ubiquinone oxidoreductase subunit I
MLRLMTGLGSLLTGMSITFKEMMRTLIHKPVTLQYPHEKPVLSPNFRGAIKLIRFEEMDSHDCVACMQCVKICPSFCIQIEGGRVEGIKKKRAEVFTMDFALCSLCGLCLDVCPTTTLEYSAMYDDAGYSRDWNFDLLDEFRDGEMAFRQRQSALEVKEAAAKEAKKAAAQAAKAAKEAAATEAQPTESSEAATEAQPTESSEAATEAQPTESSEAADD